jgi:hypothetical protein
MTETKARASLREQIWGIIEYERGDRGRSGNSRVGARGSRRELEFGNQVGCQIKYLIIPPRSEEQGMKRSIKPCKLGNSPKPMEGRPALKQEII